MHPPPAAHLSVGAPEPGFPAKIELSIAAGVHLGALIFAGLSWQAAGLAGLVVAGLVAALSPKRYGFATRHAREAFNFNASLFLYAMIGVFVAIYTMGFGLIIFVPIWLTCVTLWLTCSVVAFMRAMKGKEHRYPLTIRFWK